jgi:hypothetical protein
VAPLNGAIIQGFTGIGTINPLWRLTLEGNGSQNWDSTLLVASTGANPTGTFVPEVVLRASNNAGLAVNEVFGRFIVQSQPGGAQANPTGMDVLHRGFSGGPQTALRFLTCAGAGPLERVRIDEDGNVGIGDVDPTEARLVVRGNVAGNVASNRQFTSANTTLVADAGIAMGFSIYATNAIVAEGNVVAGGAIVATSNVTPSDSRLKNVLRVSNAASDLETLSKIRITDYRMKDPAGAGSGEIKKVIAQQVEEIYPQAISRTTGYLPDVLAAGKGTAKGNGVFEISVEAPHHLEAGTKVKLLLANGEPEFATVTAAAAKSFTVKLKPEVNAGKVFVYGRQVTDLRAVDYDALSMLNISATQELVRKISVLEEENAQLKAQTAKLATLASKMEKLEKLVSTPQADKGRRVTVLSR